MVSRGLLVALAGIAFAHCIVYLLCGGGMSPAVRLSPSLEGRIAVVTGASRGVGRGMACGLCEAGATVYATGRTAESVAAACHACPGPGVCLPRVVDSRNDTALEDFFADIASKHQGKLDILVNNAFGGIAHWHTTASLGRPFWETGMPLYDAIHDVGVRSHYLATVLAMPLLRRASDRGLVINTNSPGCLLYTFNVPYGIGKCAVDKMTADMAIEAATEGVDIVSWWPQEPMQTDAVLDGALEGTTARRGLLPGLGHLYTWLGLRFDALATTALAGTVWWEGRTLAAFARDAGVSRAAFSSLPLRTSHMAARYGIRDERGISPPPFFSLKWSLVAMVPTLREWAHLTTIPEEATTPETKLANINKTPPPPPPSPVRVTLLQSFVFNVLPDVTVPIWMVKLLAGTPATIQWPWLTVAVDTTTTVFVDRQSHQKQEHATPNHIEL